MNGSDLDRLARSLADAGGTRRSLLAGFFVVVGTSGLASDTTAKRKKKKITICNGGQTLTVRKKGWQSHYPGATVGACSGPTDVCADCLDTCYATLVTPPDVVAGYDCCPAELLCRSTSTLPDQCCYAEFNEYCRPSLVFEFTVELVDTNCCRPCNGNGSQGGCCTNSSFECDPVSGDCVPSGTARLPRTRRPA
jgi:hypothetical protein